jgi:ABC-2 type transport system ATP-binding protein/lipopolysaccharide transport system ATP-binding protein
MSRLQLDKIGVDFPIFGSRKDLRLSLIAGATGGRILPKRLQAPIIVKALEDISLELRSGDRVGLMGHNGAGKSTLLRVMGGIYHPTYGRLRVEGKLTPLLNMTPGIEQDDSGYENIITVGLMLGMSLEEITEKAPGIIEFSGLGDYIHLPIRTYSTGMQARLTFSIATSLDPGILLLDEGIGAADAGFSDKAHMRTRELMAKTDILVLASHSDALIESMCDKAALLHHGRLLEYGSLDTVRKAYQRVLQGG